MDSFMIVFYKVFSFFGFLLFFTVIGAGTYDVLNIENDFEYSQLHLTDSGVIKHGFVIDAHIFCENKYLALEVSELTFYYKKAGAKREADLKLASICAKWKQSNISVPIKAPIDPATNDKAT
ncbi:hypothetical protein MNBD_GAMMA12-561 [hydrothermal vent metagenome]|uniref:Uncharacterized protein n=1 Tax=hydrothermal vent metagenome TaxID=652676 RepID=A0A3B0YD34_9ZZZZ